MRGPLAGTRRAELLAAALLLAALTCVLFAPALRPGRVFYFRDISQNHHPYRQLTVETLRSGEAPLWNPMRGAGQPLLANPNTLVLHPTTLLFLLLPFEWAFSLSIIGQVLLAALGTWLVLRDAGAGRAGALVGACAFAFSGVFLSLGNLLNLLDGASFLPLTLWLAGRALTRRFAPWGPLAAASLAVQILAGEPAVLLVTALAFAGLHATFPAPAGRVRPSLGWRAASAAGIAGLALALAMAGLLPGIEMLSRSERALGFEPAEAMKWSLPPLALGEVAVRGLFGDPTRMRLDGWWGGRLHDTGLPFLLSLYVGPGVLLLAAAGLWAGWRAGGARRLESLLNGALAACGVALALGRYLPIYPALMSVAGPLQNVRYPVKYALLFAWAAALLAARGYDAIAARADRPIRWAPFSKDLRPAVLQGAAIAVCTVVVWGTGLLGWTSRFAHEAAAGSSPGAAVAIGGRMNGALLEAGIATAILAAAAAARMRIVSPALLACVPIVMLIGSGRAVNPVAPSEFYTRRPALLDVVDQDGSTRLWGAPRPRGFAFRTPDGPRGDSLEWGFLWDRMTLRNATAFPLGLRFAYDRGNERLDILPGAAVGRRLSDHAAAGPLDRPDARLLAIAGVRRVVQYGSQPPAGWTEAGRLEGESNVPVTVLEVPGALPRVHAVTRAEVQPESDRALLRLQDEDFDPLTTVLLEEGSAAGWVVPAAEGPPPRAAIVEETPSRLRVRAWLPSPGHVVLADTFYPGWRARVDGAEQPILRANTMFRAVEVSAGEHEVIFSYEPPSVRNGLLISAVSLVLAGLLAVPRSG